MKKRIVSLMLATTMLTMTVMSGCGGESATSQDDESSKEQVEDSTKTDDESDENESESVDNLEEPFEITYQSILWGDDTYEDGSYCEKLIEENLNVEIEVVKVDRSSIDSVLATGQMAEVMWDDSKTPEYMMDQGLIRTIPKSMVEEYAPSLAAFYEQYPILEQASTDPEDPDSYTSFRGMTATYVKYSGQADCYRYDWIQKLNIDLGVEVEQIADRVYVAKDGIEVSKFKEIMEAFVTQDPDGNGEDDTYGVTAENLLQSCLLSGYGLLGGVNDVDGEAEQYYATEEFKNYLKDFAGLYTDGLLDAEIIENNRKLCWDKVTSNKSGYFNTTPNSAADWATDRPPLALLDQVTEATILLTPGLKPDGGEMIMRANHSPAYGYCYIRADVDDAKLARILQMLEACVYQDSENNDFKISLYFGEKGVNWDYDGNGGITVIDALEQMEKGKSTFVQFGQDPYMGQLLNENNIFAIGMDFWGEDGSWREYDSLEYKEDVYGETEYATIYAESNGDIQEYVNNYMAQAVLGQIDVDETWDAYLEELDRLGYNEMMAELDKVDPLADLAAGK